MNRFVDLGENLLKGTPASPGVAVGEIRMFTHKDLEIPSGKIDRKDEEREIEKARQVLEHVDKQLSNLQNTQSDREIREILEAQIQIVRDPELFGQIEHLIREENRQAVFALYHAFNEYIQLLNQTGRDWIKDRIIDLQSLRDRMIYQIGDPETARRDFKGAVIFVDELSPSEMVEYSDSGISAVVMQHGGTTSHAVIIAQSLGIPCIIGTGWKRSKVESTRMAAVDGNTGEVILDPDQNILKIFNKRELDSEAIRQQAISISRKPNRTACGKEFTLRSNIEFIEELRNVTEYGAEGIGLLRTETLFLSHGYFDVDRHAEFYQKVLEESAPDPVTIRLLDIGGDKFPGSRVSEANPYLGWRGMRMLLDETDLFDKQVEAVIASAEIYPERVRILLPMVSDVSEIRTAKKRIRDMIRSRDGIQAESIGKLPVGVMVEVPSIALQAREAARYVDFMSIGSNDLTQYVMATDRGNERVSKLFRSSHPSVLKLIRMTAEAAEKEGIPLSVCGEMAGKPILASALLGMGIRELSMNTMSIPAVKKLICSLDLETMENLYRELIESEGLHQSEKIIRKWKERYLTDES